MAEPVDKKKMKSLKNAEKRRERSKVAARCRRGKESEIFNDISECLPISESSRSGMDKASVMRLAICNLKLKKMMENIFPSSTSEPSEELNEEFDCCINQAVGGFILVLNLEGDVVYVSDGVTTHLGISQYEIMGQSIFGFTCESDHHDIKGMLAVKKGDDEGAAYQRSGLFKMKNTITGRGRNAHLRSASYKVINCIGTIFMGSEIDENNQWFVGVCEPLLHPSDVDIPLNKQSFLSKHSPDMKFEYVDESVAELMGYSPAEMIGKSLFEFHHAADGEGVAKSFKSLYDKTQNITDCYRFLTKGGGWVWITTQATVIPSENHCRTPNSVVCIHFITSGREQEDAILSEVQLPKIAPAMPATPSEKLQTTASVSVPKGVLSEKKVNLIAEKIPTVQLIKPNGSGIYTAEENEFIAELLSASAPLLNNATCSTAKIFAPRTEDMDTGFLMPVDDTLIISKGEPEDLTHLAPVAGDESVTLDVPLLEDLLATLDEASFSFVDPNYDELPRFELHQHIPPINQEVNFCIKTPGVSDKEPLRTETQVVPSPMLLHSSLDPPMLHSPGSSVLSPYQNQDSPASVKSQSDLLSPPAPLNQTEDPLFSERLISNTPSPGPFSLNVEPSCSGVGVNSLRPIPSFAVSPPLRYETFSVQTENDPAQKALANDISPWEKLSVGQPSLYPEDSITAPLLIDKNEIPNTSPTICESDSIDQIPSQLLHPPDAEEMAELDQQWLYSEGIHVLNMNEADLDLGQIQPTPSKLPKLIHSRGNMSGQNEDRPIVIFVPVVVNTGSKRRGSMSSSQSSGSGSDGETNGVPRSGMFGVTVAQGLRPPELNRYLHDYALEQINSQNPLYSSALEYAPARIESCPKRVRKRNFAGTLLGDNRMSLHELTRQECEVNAPINIKTELLQGPDILVALDTGMATNEAAII